MASTVHDHLIRQAPLFRNLSSAALAQIGERQVILSAEDLNLMDFMGVHIQEMQSRFRELATEQVEQRLPSLFRQRSYRP